MYFTIPIVLALAATTAFSLPSPKDRREDGIARRARGGNNSSPNPRDSPQPQFSSTLSGAVLNTTAGTVTGVTGSFTVPTLNVPEGDDPQALYAVATAMGLDWLVCQNGGIVTGIIATLQNGTETFTAYTFGFPGSTVLISDFTVSAGDNITVNVTATNATSGTVVITNQSTNQTVSEVVPSGPLCLEEADVLIEFYNLDGTQVPFADFGTLNTTGASAQTSSGPLGFSGTTTFDLEQNGTVLTSVSASNSSVQITFL